MRFRIAPPGEVVRPLVPDIAFLSFEALPAQAPPELVEVPLAAPTVVVEILSADDRTCDIDDKIDTNLRAGCEPVIIVEPRTKSIALHSPHSPRIRILGRGDRLRHVALPDFTLDIDALFAKAEGRAKG